MIRPYSTVTFSIKIKMEEDPDCTALLDLSRKLDFFSEITQSVVITVGFETQTSNL